MKGVRLPQQLFIIVALLCPLLVPANPLTNYTPATTTTPCPERCRCATLPFSLLGSTGLRTVDCSKLQLSTVPTNIPRDTEALLLDKNNLTDLYGQLPNLFGLKVLDLSHNQIKQLGRGQVFHNFTELRVLNLSHNDFKTVFNGVFREVPRLQYLTMTHVRIKFVEEHVFDGLKDLQLLSLAFNHLSAIFPEWFKELPQLQKLYLEHNHISYVNSGSFTSLKNLRELSLSSNKIRGISDSAFSGLENLMVLYVDNNLLTKVPSASLQATRNLKLLKLGGNDFAQLHTGDFVDLPLEETSIEDIANLSLVDRGTFRDLPYLKVLHLHHNPKLTFVDPQAFVNVPNLRILSLHSNNLSALSKDIVDGFRSSVQITLYENPLLCDCNIKWIRDVLNSNKNQSSGVNMLQSNLMVCDQPRELSQTPVKDLEASLLPETCPPVLVGAVNKTVEKKVDDAHIFQCRAHGQPPPKIRWILPTGTVLNQTSNDIHIQLKHPGSLSIYHLKPKDSGTYMCVAENPLGEATGITELTVDNIDIHIFPLGVSATFVTVVWNGTARNRFPEYEIVYRQENENDKKKNRKYQSVTVSQIFRSHTINNLQPHSVYKFCIGVKNKEDRQYVQFSCTWVRTKDESFMLQGISHTSNVAVASVLGIIATMLIVVCLVTLAARKYRQRHYDTPEKSLVTHMSQIPMENLHSPLMSHVGP